MSVLLRKLGCIGLVLWGSLGSIYAQEKINQVDADGKKQGLWKGFFEQSKRLRYQGMFKNGVEVDTFKYYDDTKAQSLLATRIFSENGTVAKTVFYDQKKFKVSEGTTINRLKEGLWVYYHKASKQILKEEYYKNDKLHGKQIVYFPGGALAEEVNYVNGLKEGVYKVFLENGIIAEESYFVKNEYHGPAIFRDGKGNVISKGNFVKNEKKGIWEFYNEGKLVKKEKYPLRVKFEKRTNIPKP